MESNFAKIEVFSIKSQKKNSGYVGKIKARFGKINAPHHGMYHLGAVPAEFTLIHGRFGQPEKNPPERQAEIPGIFLPHE